MSDHEFRNPDKVQVLPLREYLRRELPNGRDGFVVEDLDLLIRHFGPRYGTDSQGRFMLIEEKRNGCTIGAAQQRTFGLVDEVLRKGDPNRERYTGYYLLNTVYDGNNELAFPLRVNGQTMTRDQFHQWLEGALRVQEYFGADGWGRRNGVYQPVNGFEGNKPTQ